MLSLKLLFGEPVKLSTQDGDVTITVVDRMGKRVKVRFDLPDSVRVERSSAKCKRPNGRSGAHRGQDSHSGQI